MCLIWSLAHKIPADDKKGKRNLNLFLADHFPSAHSATMVDPSPNSDMSLSPF